MAAAKLLISLFIVVSLLLFLGARADAEADAGEAVVASPPAASDDSRLRLEIEQLKAKLSSLESGALERTQELKSKDVSIRELEKAVQEKSGSIVFLQRERESLRSKGDSAADEQVGKARTQVGDLEKQIESLKAEIKAKSRKIDALEVQAGEAEKKLQELNLGVEKLQKINNEQKHTIQKTERSLKVAKEELTRARLEARSKTKKLAEIHGSWLPPWLETHIIYFQNLAVTHWTEHGKPALNDLLQLASGKLTQAQRWVRPHLETAKTKWVPAVKEQWAVFTAYVQPHLQRASTQTIEFYKASANKMEPHISRVQEVADPYFLGAKKFSKFYINQLAIATKPHVEKARVALKPYTKHVVRSYRKFLRSTTKYHHQVQAAVMENLKKYELTKPYATKELAWFLASTFLAFPAFFLYRFLSAILCKKARKPVRKAHQHHTSRRHKRRHADK